jgi:hypothetical protein
MWRYFLTAVLFVGALTLGAVAEKASGDHGVGIIVTLVAAGLVIRALWPVEFGLKAPPPRD